MELRFHATVNDYLIYGISEEMLYDISMSNAQRLLPVEIKTIEENMKYLASKSIEVSEKIGEEPLGVLMQLFLEELEKSKKKFNEWGDFFYLH